ncbi:MAG: NAD(P)-dependent oxidoreductase [Chloroflexi bacterium]|nr:NAD(P)-dependent oxidoreductase [Chloroflexota bacterium]
MDRLHSGGTWNGPLTTGSSKPFTLVTGGAGRLGQALVASLVQHGCRVRVFDLAAAVAHARFHSEVETVAGDLCTQNDVKAAVEGVDIVIHLAAIMAPQSEQQPDTAYKVNVSGTQTLLDALPDGVHLIHASSVAAYGVPKSIPVTTDHPQDPVDVYGKTKQESESLVRTRASHWTILRIAPISVPAVYDLPEPWPFAREQKVEFVATQDVVTAVTKLAAGPQSSGSILNLAGGAGWQMTAQEYSNAVSQALHLDPAWATFQASPGWGGWYDTTASQELLNYQLTRFPAYIEMLKSLYRDLIG